MVSNQVSNVQYPVLIIQNNFQALNIFLKVIENMRGPIVFTWLTKAANSKSCTFTTLRTSALFPGLKSKPIFFLLYIILGNKILQLIYFYLNYVNEHSRYYRLNPVDFALRLIGPMA